MLTEGAEFLKRATMVMVFTRKALGLLGLRTKKEGLRWQSLLQGMEALAQERRVDPAGIEALRLFTEIWDNRILQWGGSKGPHKGQPVFSVSQIRAMAGPLAAYEAWLRTNFPDAFSPSDHSRN
jgi:hypothetical protein